LAVYGDSLALITLIASTYVPETLLNGFRLIIVYGFAISLIATAPVVIVVTRLVGDAIYLRSYTWVKPLFVGSLMLAAGIAALSGFAIYFIVFPLPTMLALVGTSFCALVGLLWIALAFSGTIRDYHGTTVSFIVGLCASVAGTVCAARFSGTLNAMIWAFEAGLMIVFCCLCARILTIFPQPVVHIYEPIRVLCRGILRFWHLALGGFIAAIGLWIDKWIIWLGPSGISDETGLIHAPIYDSAMFAAYLAIIPSLSLFMTHLETSFIPSYKSYYEAIRTHATLAQIERNAGNLQTVTVESLTQIILVQATICFIAALGAPSIVQAIGLHYQQVGILRLGALGALFQFVFLATTSLFLFFERESQFLYLQTMFLILQTALTSISVWIGNSYYGFGNLVTCVLCGLVALGVLIRTLNHLTYMTFIVANSGKSTAVKAKSVISGTPS
jgi:uncharacterized membrane protein